MILLLLLINQSRLFFVIFDSSQAESYYGKYVFTTPFALRDFVGVSDIESLGPYVKTQWRDFKDKLLGKPQD